ncbi:hypothetical protein HDU76_002788 [Blyttiomyces sp. JEL0837]|nr:hypothetical protein HDU76_002788 [Blyttiomyces sp. JEL0837]
MVSSLPSSVPQIALDYITLQGGSSSPGVNYYKGIPYAAPPVRNDRWKPPKPPINVTGTIYDATDFRNVCWQAEASEDISQSEDCLFLNIWTPSTATPSSNYTVMVWIHGGAFQMGSGSEDWYDGTSIVNAAKDKGNVVYVNLNYRLGLFGFFSNKHLLEEGNGANFGLLDQEAALLWVKKYISAFGGNPNDITVFGESAGAKMYGDSRIICTSEEFVNELMKAGTVVYNYRFDHNVDNKSFYSAHTTDLYYTFNTSKATDNTLVEKMMSWWISFAKTGDPNTLSAPNTIKWPVYRQNEEHRLLINVTKMDVETRSGVHKARCEFLQVLERDAWVGEDLKSLGVVDVSFGDDGDDRGGGYDGDGGYVEDSVDSKSQVVTGVGGQTGLGNKGYNDDLDDVYSYKKLSNTLNVDIMIVLFVVLAGIFGIVCWLVVWRLQRRVRRGSIRRGSFAKVETEED